MPKKQTAIATLIITDAKLSQTDLIFGDIVPNYLLLSNYLSMVEIRRSKLHIRHKILKLYQFST